MGEPAEPVPPRRGVWGEVFITDSAERPGSPRAAGAAGSLSASFSFGVGQAIALAVALQDVAAVGQPIERGAGEPF